MPDQLMDLNAPSLQGAQPKMPEDLPHGLIAPPDLVREAVAREKAEFPPEIYTPEAEERALNRYTLHYCSDYLGYEVLYRSTSEGPEVLAVGLDEILAFENGTPAEEQLDLTTWLP
jgi:hypothetical protein